MKQQLQRRVKEALKHAQSNANLSQDEIKAIRLRCEEIKQILNECKPKIKSSERG